MSPGAATADGAAVSALNRVRSERALKAAQAGAEATPDVLSRVDWVQALYAQPGMELLVTFGAMSSGGARVGGVDPDHLFHAMLRQRLIADIAFMYRPGSDAGPPVFHTLVAMGPDVAGHPRITHGGFTAAVIDETTGGLVFELKKADQLGAGPAYTAHLEVDFKAPLPVGIVVCCTAALVSVEGRKIWVAAEMMDRPGGKVFATGKALYVTPR